MPRLGHQALAGNNAVRMRISGLPSRHRAVAPASGRLLALALCLPISAYFGVSALFAITHYMDYGSSTVPLIVRYIVAPGALALFFLTCPIFLHESTGVMIGMYGAAVLIALFGFEALLTFRVFSAEMDMLGRIETPGAKQGLLSIVPLKAMNAALEVDRPSDAMLAGIPYRRTLLCAEDGVPVAYDADRLGFNNPDGLHERAVDILVLGDSFIEGMCLAPGEDVVSRLREWYPNSINMAVRGNGPLLELAALGRYGAGLQPRHVIIAFFEGNDWRNLELELALSWLRAALTPGVDFGPIPAREATLGRARQLAHSSAEREKTAWHLLTHGQNLRNFFALHHAANALGLLYARAPKDHPEYVEVLRRAKEMTGAWGGRLAVLYLPRPERFIGLLPRAFSFDPLRTIVLAAAREAGVEVVDLVPRFAEDEAPTRFYAANGHFSEEGAKQTARILADYLARTVAAEVASSKGDSPGG
jgi:hypothetical protein